MFVNVGNGLVLYNYIRLVFFYEKLDSGFLENRMRIVIGRLGGSYFIVGWEGFTVFVLLSFVVFGNLKSVIFGKVSKMFIFSI